MAERAQTQAKPTTVPVLPVTGSSLQRQCACGTHTIGDKCDSCKGGAGLVQRKAAGGRGYSKTPPIVHEVMRSPGESPETETRAGFTRFSSDLSSVRVHTDRRASVLATKTNTLARIATDTDQHRPEMSGTRNLLAGTTGHISQPDFSQPLLREEGPQASNDTFGFGGEKTAKPVWSGNAGSQRHEGILQRKPAASASASPCGTPQIFTMIDTPWPIKDKHFIGSALSEPAAWNTALSAARKGKCEAKGSFDGVKLSWDLNNPKLGTILTFVELNKRDATLDVEVHAVFDRQPCCSCFFGAAAYSFNVSIDRIEGGKTESGKTKQPITGTTTSSSCSGQKCCPVDQVVKLNETREKFGLKATVEGTVLIKGDTYSD